MSGRLDRLLRPRSIAVVGGGAWCANVIAQCRKMGFAGEIWPVHPTRTELEGVPVFKSVEALPDAPDATFIGVNREATVAIVGALADIGAGGAVCFASGFAEAEAEIEGSAGLQDDLLAAAKDMPILGPNCYGFINYLDGALLWPDQHGGHPCERGVALLLQSSNIAINMTMQARGLPLAYVVTVGNQAQTGMAEIAERLLADDRVTAIGLHVEGFQDLRAFEALAEAAQKVGKRIVVLKVGKSEQARRATVSHTASLAGSDAGALALIDRLGFLPVFSLTAMLETLKLLHVTGGLVSGKVSAVSCSGGEASLVADTAVDTPVTFPPLGDMQQSGLRAVLGPKVALANPLDYHTYIWNDVAAMTATFAAMAAPEVAITLVIVDFPRADRCDPTDWDNVITAVCAARAQSGGAFAIVSTLPEALPEHVASALLDQGVVPLCGVDDALTAVSLASRSPQALSDPVCQPGSERAQVTLVSESEAKDILAEYGLRVPVSARASTPDAASKAACDIGFPVVLKGEGLAHKTEAGAVALNLMTGDEVHDRADRMALDSYLIEEMVSGGLVELLVGVVRDPAHGFVLTLAAGGVLTELLEDRQNLLLPVSDQMLDRALENLRVAKLLKGYRGAAAADLKAIKRAVRAIESYVIDTAASIVEVEVNPLICTETDAIAADALIRKGD